MNKSRVTMSDNTHMDAAYGKTAKILNQDLEDIAVNNPLVHQSSSEEAQTIPLSEVDLNSELEAEVHSPFSTIGLKHFFIRAVFGSLAAQLVIVFALVYAFVDVATTMRQFHNMYFLAFTIVIYFLFVFITGSLRCHCLRQRWKSALLYWAILTTADSYVLGFVTVYSHTNLVYAMLALFSLYFYLMAITAFQQWIECTPNRMMIAGWLLMAAFMCIYYFEMHGYLQDICIMSLLFTIILIYVNSQMENIISGSHPRKVLPGDWLYALLLVQFEYSVLCMRK